MSGSSGGGSSGEVSWPKWLSDIHEQGTKDMLVLMKGTTSSNPFDGMLPYDPNRVGGEIAEMHKELAAFNTDITAFDPSTQWEAMLITVKAAYDTIIADDVTVAASVAAYSDILTDDLLNKTLPRFHAGMRDINAVQSTAFIIGEALLEAFKGREVAKYAADLKGDVEKGKPALLIQTAGKLLEPEMVKIELRQESHKLAIDTLRMMIVARKEYQDELLSIQESDKSWDVDKWVKYGNFIAAMSGGTTGVQKKSASSAQSAIGGALSGASAGGSIGGWWGAAAGAVIGAGASLANR